MIQIEIRVISCFDYWPIFWDSWRYFPGLLNRISATSNSADRSSREWTTRQYFDNSLCYQDKHVVFSKHFCNSRRINSQGPIAQIRVSRVSFDHWISSRGQRKKLLNIFEYLWCFFLSLGSRKCNECVFGYNRRWVSGDSISLAESPRLAFGWSTDFLAVSPNSHLLRTSQNVHA